MDIEEWTRLNEEGYFIKRHEEYLKNRTFEKPSDNVFRVSKNELKEGIPAFALFHKCGLAKSRSAARRLIEQGGAYVNSVRMEKDAVLDLKHVIAAEIVLRAGKKHMKRIIVK